jgi:hypothetical protein
MKCFIVLVVTGATRIVIKGLNKYFAAKPGNQSFNRLSTKYSCPRVIIHNEENTMILKPE